MHHSYPSGDNQVVTLDTTAAWLDRLAADLAGGHGRDHGNSVDQVVCRLLPSGAELAFVGGVVVKLHHPRTDAAALGRRLRQVTSGAGPSLWVQPLQVLPRRAPDGRCVTVWPRVEVVAPEDAALPWADSGRLLARLHLASGEAGDAPDRRPLPRHGGPARVSRALRRAGRLDRPAAPMLTELGRRLLKEIEEIEEIPTSPAPAVVHGDWHLGQLARTPAGLRLLDVDDLGTGDPAWDLARPAGLWAAGALEDADWRTFLTAYRTEGGPGVPAYGDPWPRLDLAARCAVYVAAVRALAVQPAHSANPAEALLEACARM
ncbi:aminoglycoside phosphotransferase [Terrabacter tumescens]|uniref:Aminoglycoside phosphotransferase n=1 Tax=Terrabacter tumescens TaxID=60443 RepID=A0ABQ2I7T6_9MICO|nr:aminoglycoside phosphotransferase [Terrabacter tumescens]